ncbi:MAG: Hsp20/alpha crystallin family protein [Chloroflexi bacterium]|nr:Hsp20/alpha crystallin family protein [Chloroflexota bacterium]
MSIVRWNPIREMLAMQSALDRMFDDTRRGLGEAGSALALDVHEDDKVFTVVTSLPGVKPENINVSLHEDVLTITGEIPAQTRENARTLMQERVYGKFTRSLRLPQAVNSGAVEAVFDNGVLTLTLPKTEEAQPKQIPVKVGNGKR